MNTIQKSWGTLYETDMLILGTGASGIGAALKAAEKGCEALMIGKGTLESSGSLGGGNDHFMAVLDTDEPYDDKEAFINFYMKSAYGYKREQLAQWHDAFKPCLAVLDEVGTEFKPKEGGGRFRSVGFGQPGAWWLHIVNGRTIKRNLAKKVRKLPGIQVLMCLRAKPWLFPARLRSTALAGMRRERATTLPAIRLTAGLRRSRQAVIFLWLMKSERRLSMRIFPGVPPCFRKAGALRE